MGRLEEFLKIFDKKNDTLRGKALRGLCLFFGLMLGFTVLSRAADGVTIARVRVEQPSPRTLDRSITVQGRVTAEREVALRVRPGLVVESIPVLPGQQVEKGEVLLEIDREDLAEQIRTAKLEIKKMELSQRDAKSQRALANSQQKKARQRAREDYAKAKKQSSRAVAEAEKELKQAKEKLADFRKKKKDAAAGEEGGADSVRKSLEDGRAEKEKALERALEEETRLIAAREAAVGEALKAARGENPSLTAPEEEEIRSETEQKYQGRMDGAGDAADQAEKALEEAEKALEDYDARQEKENRASLDEQEEALKADVELKEKEVKAAKSAGQDSRETARRTLEDAGDSQEEDGAGEIADLELEQKRAELETLEALKGGKILAPVDGVVTEICAVVGDRTSEGAALRLADVQQGCRFTADITGEQEKYLAPGDPVTLQAEGTGKTLGEFTVDSVMAVPRTEGEEEADAPKQYRVAVRMGEDGSLFGSLVTMTCEKKTQKYQTTVPLAALHQDNQKNFVWVIHETASALGRTLAVQRVDVTVTEKNDSFAALTEGSLTGEQKIVVYADRSIEAGSRVRVEAQEGAAAD